MKWVEVEPLSNIRDLDAKRFIWKNIVTRSRVPHKLILVGIAKMGIRNRYFTLAYP